MATTTDLDQTGRDANILHNYLDGEPPLRPANEYGRLGQLILRLIEELGSGTLLQYDGRVDSVSDLPDTGQLNHFYLVGPEDSENFDEYFWVEPEGETGHWDRLGSVAIIIDDHLDLNSANPVQNGIITAAINAINLALAAKANSADLATVATSGSYTDLSNTPTIDAAPTSASTNAVQSGGVYTALEGKVTEGSGYAVINGTRVYVSSTTPTGTIPEGSLGIGF